MVAECQCPAHAGRCFQTRSSTADVPSRPWEGRPLAALIAWLRVDCSDLTIDEHVRLVHDNFLERQRIRHQIELDPTTWAEFKERDKRDSNDVELDGVY